MDIKIKLTEEQVRDIVIGALESAIGYWGGTDNTKEPWKAYKVADLSLGEKAYQILKGGDVVAIYDIEEGDEWFINLERLQKGIEKQGVHPDYMDDNDYDAIIQYALFDEIVFG